MLMQLSLEEHFGGKLFTDAVIFCLEENYLFFQRKILVGNYLPMKLFGGK